MYLSIGNDMAVRDSSIIGIFDLDNTTTSKRTRDFLAKSEENGEVVPCDELPKSFILTSEDGPQRGHPGKTAERKKPGASEIGCTWFSLCRQFRKKYWCGSTHGSLV